MKQFDSTQFMLEGLDGYKQAIKNESQRRFRVKSLVVLGLIVLVTVLLCL